MLESISINNIALIGEAFIEFGEGLNVITGETGAGKSMIIDSLNFALGEKIGKDIVRTGEKSGRVEVVFIINERTEACLKTDGIDVGDEGLIIISRTINDSGRISTKINGETVTTAMLKKISDELIDIHGQHEHQSLLNVARHIDMVDEFCGESVALLKTRLQTEFKVYKELLKKIEDIKKNLEERESRLDFLEFQISELEEARLVSGEEERLIVEKKAASSADRLSLAVGAALDSLYDNEINSAEDGVNSALAHLQSAIEHDSRLEPLFEQISNIAYELSEISRDLRKYFDRIESDPNLIDEIEQRLNQIYIIKRKYGGTVEAALESLEKMISERDMLQGAGFDLEQLDKEYSKKEEEIFKLCDEISDKRKKASEKMERAITEALKDMSMKEAKLVIKLEPANLTQNGGDKIEFFLSANKGEALKPLAKTASGGEMSRVMLAIKSVAAGAESIETYIFDEIDTGISGRTAQKVAEKMAAIAESRQIISITHLPQIAAMADRHILIEKATDGGKTKTIAEQLDEKAVTKELGRLLGGAKITEQTLKAAIEMRELAKELKKHR